MTVAIRLASDRDAPAIADIYAPFVESSAISFETEAPLADEIRRRVRATTITHPWLVCVCGDRHSAATGLGRDAVGRHAFNPRARRARSGFDLSQTALAKLEDEGVVIL